MAIKTENAAEVGIHVFERTGLGIAPFCCVGFETKIFKAAPDAPSQPGASCDYCGTGIMLCCKIKSSDGRTFIVGSNCVDKTGDAGMIHAYKTSREYRDHQADLREAKDKKNTAEAKSLLSDPSTTAILASKPHPMAQGSSFFAEKTLLDWATWMMQNAGASGRTDVLKRIKKETN